MARSRLVRPQSFASQDQYQAEVKYQPVAASTTRVRDEHGATIDQGNWRPFWLRPWVLGSFFGLFLLLVAGLTFMIWYSRTHDGLCEAADDLLYLWRFGPAAILTLISTLWSRVELQALRYMHWVAIRAGKPLGRKGYKLDYTQMLLPMVLLRSLWLRHFLVFLAVTISIVLKIQIVLSAGLFQPRALVVEHPINITILDAVVNEDWNIDDQNVAYHMARAVRDFGLVLPYGVSPDFNYQTFKERGTVESPITAQVDGLFMNMTCFKPQSCTAVYEEEEEQDFGLFTLSFHFEECAGPVIQKHSFDTNGTEIFESFDDDIDQCPFNLFSSRSSRSRKYFWYWAALDRSGPLACGGVVCSPAAWISDVQVVDDGISPNLTVLGNEGVDANLQRLDSWELMVGCLPPFSEGQFMFFPIQVAPEIWGREWDAADTSQSQTDALEQVVFNLTDFLRPMVSYYLLRHQEESQAEGMRTEEVLRLRINEPIGLSMAALFALAGVVAFLEMIRTRQLTRIWFRDPATILGSMIFFSRDDHNFQEGLSQYSTRSNGGSNKTCWSHGMYSPIILRSWLRAIVILFVMGLIAGLSYSLRRSELGSDGLVTVSGPDSRFSLIWSSIPPLIMLVVTQYVSMTDSAIRGLANLWVLSIRDCTISELDTSLLDMLGFRALYYSIRMRIAAVTVSQLLVTITTFLTAISAVLFTVKSIPEDTSVVLQRQDWFGTRLYPNGGDQTSRENIGTLLVAGNSSNLTWPSNTYADLLFPAPRFDDFDWEDYTSVAFNITAAKLANTCTPIPKEQVYINVTEPSSWLGQRVSCPDPESGYSTGGGKTQTFEDGSEPVWASFPSPSNPYMIDFACDSDRPITAGIPGTNVSVPWRLQTYLWGIFSGTTGDFDYLSAWQCNYSWAGVLTQTTLLRADNNNPMIDFSNPPIQIGEMQPWTPPFEVPDLYDPSVFPDLIGNYDPWTLLSVADEMFSVVLEPNGPISEESLGDPNSEDRILETLHFLVGLASAQVANLENRLAIDERSVMQPEQHEELLLIEAKASRPLRWRLIQNPTPTYILIGILSCVVVVNLWALISNLIRRVYGRHLWLLNMDLRGLAPDDFSSVEMMQSLLHGSNFRAILPSDAHIMNQGEILRQRENKRFRLGWFEVGSKMERTYTIAEVHDEAFLFVGEKAAIRGDH